MKFSRFLLNPPLSNWIGFKGVTLITSRRQVPNVIVRCWPRSQSSLVPGLTLELALLLTATVFDDEIIAEAAARGPMGVVIDVKHGAFPELALMAISNGAKFVHLQHERRTASMAAQYVRWLRKRFPKLPMIVEPRHPAELLELAICGATNFATGSPWRLKRWLRLFGR